MSSQNYERWKLLMDEGVDPVARIIILGHDEEDSEEAGTSWKMQRRLARAITLLEQKNSEPITIEMNNWGGDEYHGLAIYDRIKVSSCKVTIEAYGHCMSMGSWIMQAADKRIMSPNATMMLHYGTWGEHLDWNQAEAFHKEGIRLNTLMEDTYLPKIKEVKPKFSRSQLKAKLIAHDWYLSAQEAVEWGLADEVMGE